MKSLLAVALAITGALAWVYMTYGIEIRHFDTEQGAIGVLFHVVYGYAMTVLGVGLGSAYRALERMRESGLSTITNFGIFARQVYHSIDFWMALFASPIVYAALWKTISVNDLAALTIFPLENGFVCLAIISSLVAKNHSSS